MINRLVLYYGFFIPFLAVYFLGSPLLRDSFFIFLVFMTVNLPYYDHFLDLSIRKFPAFLLSTLLFTAGLFLMIDAVDFFSTFNPYLFFLMIVPSYLCFKLISYPWLVEKFGVISLKKAARQNHENNWMILAAISFLLIINSFTVLGLFLFAPVSYLLAANLKLSFR